MYGQNDPKKTLVQPPGSQEMHQLIAQTSNLPAGGGPVPGVSVGTGVFAPLNTVHVKYRGYFKEDFKCKGKALSEYLVKPCVRGFGEVPNDNEFNGGELALAVDDYNPGCKCFCLPNCFERLTLTAKDKYNGLGFTMERPCAMPCYCVPCWPLSCGICCPLKVFVRNTEGAVIGYATQAHKCCSCSSWIRVHDAAGTLIYTLNMSCCQTCCFAWCLPNMCCKHKRLAIHPANQPDTVGEVMQSYSGCLRGVFCGVCAELQTASMCSHANNFYIAFPPAAPADHKAIIMSASFLANYLFFEKTALLGCACAAAALTVSSMHSIQPQCQSALQWLWGSDVRFC